MSIIVPTINTSNPDQYKSQITQYPTFSNRLQIDISDGIFTPTASIPEDQLWYPSNVTIDLHLMVAVPSAHLESVLRLKPSLAVFHVEVDEDINPILSALKQAGIKAGVALLRPTYPPAVETYIKNADHVLILASQVGQNGARASMIQTEKIKLVKQINPTAEISWDGGVNLKNIHAITRSHADVLYVGSAISGSDTPDIAFSTLAAEMNREGVV